MYKQLKKNQGFTIIEVLIVLAIAGLILLIVFLAVPALQRSARNQQRKTDVSAILSAAGTFVDNNNGTVPSKIAPGTDANNVTLTCSAGTCSTDEAKVGIYTAGIGAGNGQIDGAVATGVQTYTGGAGKDYVWLVTDATCGVASGTATVPTYTTLQGSTSQYVALYEVESGSSTWSAQCVEG